MKLLCFTCASHHIEKLSPVILALSRNGVSVQIITASNPGAIETNFEIPLIKRKFSYRHIGEYLDEELVDEIAKEKRKILNPIFRSIKDSNSVFLQAPTNATIKYSTIDVIETLHLFKKILDEEKPNIVMVLHEANFWGKLLVYTAKSKGIPTLSFQEGLFYEYRKRCKLYISRFFEYSDKICLWGPATAELYICAGCNPDKLVVTGPPHLDFVNKYDKDTVLNLRDKMGIRKKFVSVILAKSVISPAPIDFLRSFVGLFGDSEYQVAIKFHPVDTHSYVHNCKDAIAHNNTQDFLCFHQEDVYDIMACSEAVVVSESTAGIEALALGKPLFEFCKSKTAATPFSDMGVAQRLTSTTDIIKVIKTLENGNVAGNLREAIEKFVYEQLYKLDGKATERVLDVISTLCKC